MDNDLTNAQAVQNSIIRQKLDAAQMSANPPIIQGSTIQPSGIWNQQGIADMYKRSAPRRTDICIEEVENGRIITLNGKCYIVPTGVPLIEVISLALVEAQLEK